MAKGHKNCPACKADVGCRVLTCPCGHEFTTAVIGAVKPEDFFYPVRGNTILTPAGVCPIKYCGNLTDWVHDVLASDAEGNHYSAAALKYWLRRVAPQVDVKEIDAVLTSMGA